MPRRFQFNLRTLLIATLSAGVACAWIANAMAVTQQRKEFMPLFDSHDYCLRAVGTPGYRRTTTVPWIRQVFGDYPVDVLFYYPADDPGGNELRKVRSLFPETEIWGWPHSSEGEQLPDGMQRWSAARRFMI
jgi:hypothetical protein